jgi:hypothetical protein
MPIGIFIFVLLNLVDLVSASALYDKMGDSFEANPIAQFLLIQWGIMGIVMLKVIMVTFVLVIINYIFNKDRKKAKTCLNILSGITFVGACLNIVSLCLYYGALAR